MMKGKKSSSKLTLQQSLETRFKDLKNVPDISSDLPKKWEKHGDLILLPPHCFTREEWTKMDQTAIWDAVAEYFGVSRIAQKFRISPDGHRTPQVKLLKGQNPWVCHVDNKITYSYDITKCMFSAGNITEKIRMAKLDCQGEVIVDMFAGIGYFTLPLLVHAKATFVHACEWNNDAVVALKRNLNINKVENKCKVYEGDNRMVCPEDVADRVVMGLIPTAMQSLEAACRALKLRTGGILHIHQNVDLKNSDQKTDFAIPHEFLEGVSCNKKELRPEWTQWAKQTCLLVQEIMQNIYSAKDLDFCIRNKILHIEKVKSYAPHVDHIVLDLEVIVTETD